MLLPKKNTRKFLAILLASICLVFVSCAPDLGNVKDEADYAKKFNAVTFVKSDLTKQTLSILDLYNPSAVNDFNKSDFKCPTDLNAYKYMAVFAGEDISVKEFAIYLRSEKDVDFSVYVYEAKEVPKRIATGNYDEDTEEYVNPETGEKERRIRKDFDEPFKDDAVAEVKVALKANKWQSFRITDWKTGGGKSSSIDLSSGRCLLFQFENNCVRYDEDTLVADKDLVTEVCFTAMLIYVK